MHIVVEEYARSWETTKQYRAFRAECDVASQPVRVRSILSILARAA